MSYKKKRIYRDYDQPFFSAKRKSRAGWWLFAFGLLMGGLIVLLYTQFDRVQLAVLDTIGIAPTPTPLASERATNGMEIFMSGDVDDAVVELEQAVAQQPNNIEYLHEYGKLLIAMDDQDQAVEMGERLVELAPNDPRGYAIQALALMWTDPNTAIPIAINGLDQNDRYAPLHAALAVAYTQIGRWPEGLKRGALALELDPNDPDVHRAYSYPLIYTGQYELAIEQLERAIQLNPNLTAPYFELASQYRILDNEEMAVSIYQHILEIDPEEEKAYLRLCETYSSRGYFREAEEYCYSALDINPDYGLAFKELGRMQYTQRNYEGSIESFLKCVELGEENVECYYLRGLAHFWLGQCDDAWTTLDQALSMTTEQVILNQIETGLYNVTQKCVGYEDQSLPTEVPPTPILPTPIGGA